jgi:hypothetical protein
MALVCPVDHPPGVGTTFCRICGRTYVVIEDVAEVVAEAVAEVVAPVVAEVVPEPEPELAPVPESRAFEVAYPEVMSMVHGPMPFASLPLPAGQWPHPQSTLPSQVGLLPQVELPLVPSQGGPSGTDTVPVQLEAVSVTSEAAEPAHDGETVAGRRQLDRAAVLALGGFLGGAVSGAAVTLFLS